MKKSKWTLKEQSLFLKRIGELLSRGYPLSEAIESISFQLPNDKKAEISQSLADLREGYPLYQVLANLKFNENLIGYVYFAEQHGGLGNAFQEGSEMMQKRDHDFAKLKKLLAYPLFLISLTVVLFVFVENLILPKFSSLFQSMRLKPNFFTKIVYLFGDLLPYIMISICILCFILLSFYLIKFRQLPQMKQKTILVLIPVIGPFFKYMYTHYFSIQLSYLLAGGLSVHEALRLFESNEKQPFYMEVGKEIKIGLRRGESLDNLLANFVFFEKELSHIIKHGQKNGKLDAELYFFSRHCLNLLEERTEKWLKTIQPCLYAVIGFLIISMYLAVLLPMFHLLEGF